MKFIKIRENKQEIPTAALWFHNKWGIPLEAYEESMRDSLKQEQTFPQWYLILDGSKIIGGLGIIENDFHNRKDLSPNVCALYVEKAYRNQQIAGRLLKEACDDMSLLGVDTLYLITDHTNFYERYGWEFLTMVEAEDEPELMRMYIHHN